MTAGRPTLPSIALLLTLFVGQSFLAAAASCAANAVMPDSVVDGGPKMAHHEMAAGHHDMHAAHGATGMAMSKMASDASAAVMETAKDCCGDLTCVMAQCVTSHALTANTYVLAALPASSLMAAPQPNLYLPAQPAGLYRPPISR